MYGKTEGSAGQEHTVGVFRVWRALIFLKSKPSRLSQVPSSALVPGWGRDKAANSIRSSQLHAEIFLHREISFRKILALHRLGSKRACWHQEAPALHRRQHKPLSLFSKSSKFTGVLHAGYSQISFSLQETQEGWHSKPNSDKWQVTHLQYI